MGPVGRYCVDAKNCYQQLMTIVQKKTISFVMPANSAKNSGYEFKQVDSDCRGCLTLVTLRTEFNLLENKKDICCRK